MKSRNKCVWTFKTNHKESLVLKTDEAISRDLIPENHPNGEQACIFQYSSTVEYKPRTATEYPGQQKQTATPKKHQSNPSNTVNDESVY